MQSFLFTSASTSLLKIILKPISLAQAVINSGFEDKLIARIALQFFFKLNN